MRNDIKSGELIPQIFFVLRKWESITGNREITAMNWDELEGKWKQYKGQIREKWGKLTDDDIHVIAGQREQLVGRLQERYGIAKEVAAKQADEFVKALTEEGVDDREVRRKAAGKA
ncbi:MAG: CsbD family protein [Candidatus Acidiferrales bacterium]